MPTFDRPAKAISGTVGSGKNSSFGADFRNVTGPENNFADSSSIAGPVTLNLFQGLNSSAGSNMLKQVQHDGIW